ncbi:Carbohydrate esterase 4 protein [Gryganskiella cystojenkinii]|nr:Carbohydrate esterase 4 protein [Gryganskiella cystojenkinii]
MKNIVDALQATNSKGTFFVNGDNWGCIYAADEADRLRYAYSKGHQIASLTWANKHLPTLTAAQVDSQMAQTEDAIRKITGAIPAFTRPPYGEYNNVTLQVAANRHQKLVNWDFESNDSLGATVAQQQQLFDKKIAEKPSNFIALMYEVYNTTALNVLPYAIDIIKAAGYQLVTIAECTGNSPYLMVGLPSARDDTWHC